MARLKYWLWLTTRKGVDSAAALTVLDHFLTPEQAYYADPEEFDLLPLSPGGPPGLAERSLDRAEAILADCERLGLRIMTFRTATTRSGCARLPIRRRCCISAGRVFHFDEEAAIGVVGARIPSEYGKWCASRFGLELARGGALVVSGIAEGLDTLAVQGALKGGGPVVSVLAGGVDVPFPPGKPLPLRGCGGGRSADLGISARKPA